MRVRDFQIICSRKISVFGTFQSTVSVSVIECTDLPEVPVIVSVYEPTGVPGFCGALELPPPHEASIVALARIAPNIARNSSELKFLCQWRRRAASTIASSSPSSPTISHIGGQWSCSGNP